MKMQLVSACLVLSGSAAWALWSPRPACAATRESPSCELQDVQQTVNASQDGDTVEVPVGTCSWDSPLVLDAQNRSLTVTGAGVDATRLEVRKGFAQVDGGEGRSWRLSGFTVKTAYVEAELIAVTIRGTSTAWRLDHIEFVSSPVPHPPLCHVKVSGETFGVLDHCKMSGEVANAVVVDGDNWSTWRKPRAWGSAKAVFIEDNEFRVTPPNESVAGATTDCERGGQLVFRHNTVHNQLAGNHGFDSGQHSSCLSMEVYANQHVIHTEKTSSWPWLGQVRGGTTLWFDNTFEVDPYTFPPSESGVWLTDSIALRVYRAEGASYGWHACDGTPLKLCSNIAADWAPIDGWWPLTCTTDADCTADRHMGKDDAACKWQVCSGNRMTLCDPAHGDADCAGQGTCTSYLDGLGDGTPCFQQPGRGTDSALDPAYEWNNSCVGAQPAACPGGLGTGNVHFRANVSQLVENVDYYNFRPATFDGTEGTGRGTLAERPSTCTPGVAYWATDANTLYRCGPDGSWTPYYTPYPYPHPLQGAPAGAGGSAGAADAGPGGTAGSIDGGPTALPRSSADDAGCGCRFSPDRSVPRSFLVLLLLAAASARRRHRTA
jgi:hypothetical protein